MSTLREQIARIIKAAAWERESSGAWRYRDALKVQAEAFAKADAILALQPEGEVVEAVEDFASAYRARYMTGKGVRQSAPMRAEVGELILKTRRASEAYAKLEGEEQGSAVDESARTQTRSPDAQLSDGWRLVPVNPTIDMVAAFWRIKNTDSLEPGEYGEDRSDYAAYRAMLAASPPPPNGLLGDEG